MSTPTAKFGERYFATRKKLSGVVNGVRELARTTDCALNGFSDDSELLQGLKNPFLFVVCGEVNAGKSTLINGLFGSDLCESNVLPETDRVLWYRYDDSEHDEEITEILEERYRPIDFLNDFNIVDTPGTNSVVKGHEVITERFMPVADLVLFVFPVNNPWGAATWDFIERFPDELHGRVAFVLQQKDLREPKELEIIMEHVRDIAQKKLGEKPDVFAVSGRQALRSKQREPFEERAWRESGYPALEDFISKVVTESPGRRQVLQDVRDATSSALRRIETKIESQSGVVKKKDAVLRELEASANEKRDEFGNLFEAKLEGLGEVFADEAEGAIADLRGRLGVLSSVRALFQRDELPREIEALLTESVATAVEELADVEAEEMERVCRKHWKNAVPRMKKELTEKIPAIDGGVVDFARARQNFVKRLGRGARQAAMRLKLRGVLEMQLESRRAVLRRWLVLVLVLTAVAGGLGAFSLHPWSWIVMALAVGAGLFGVVQSFRSGRELIQWFRTRAAGSGRNFASDLGKDYLEGVKEFFVKYEALFDEVRGEIFASETELRPQLEQWNDLFLELKALEQEL
ncbi:MAG: hypothetical protein HKN82_04945 [Akkermansiaceae bacterium]|nr:hypothetical protein [Akkermansiaceae bacterium]NNM29092.1 hypothetical protein [Akkermansiaceae bacterium]